MLKKIEVHISHAFSEAEWRQLQAFRDKASRLTSTKLASGGEGCSIHGKVRYEQDKGLWFEATLPSEEIISEFLMAFRFFYLQKEPTHFPRILNIIKRHTTQLEALEVLKGFGRQWESSLFGNAMNISFNNKQITTSLLLDLWFNAHYFHSDEKKELALDELKNAFSQDFAKFMLLDAVIEATKVVFKVFDGIAECKNQAK